MPEEVLFESERTQSRGEIAAYLRTVAEKLDTGEPITLRAGDDAVTLDVPAQLTFEVKAEREGPTTDLGELSLELELEWDEGDRNGDDDGGLQIE